MYGVLASWDNLLRAYRQAGKGKRGTAVVAAFEHRLEDNLCRLAQELASRTYRPGPYVSFFIRDPKERRISAAPFRDRVVHHALCNVIEPRFERTFVADSYANRTGMGTHRCLDRCQELARRHRFVLQCDVRQFWANCYLNPFDHFVKRELRCPGYVRYVDDMLLFGDDKQHLWAWKAAVVERLARFRLTIHPGAQPRPVTEGIPFLGFVVFPDRRRLKRRNAIHFGRRFRQLLRDCHAGRVGATRVTAAARGWATHAAHGNTVGLRKAVFRSATRGGTAARSGASRDRGRFQVRLLLDGGRVRTSTAGADPAPPPPVLKGCSP